jgi:hypothetical protein
VVAVFEIGRWCFFLCLGVKQFIILQVAVTVSKTMVQVDNR